MDHDHERNRTVKGRNPDFGRRLFAVGLILAAASFAGNALGRTAGSGILALTFGPRNGSTQFAVWLEDPGGGYLTTLYVTDFIGRRGGGNRSADPDIDTGDGNRLNALPVWAHRRNVVDHTFGIANVYPPSSSHSSYPADMDAVSQATPGAGPRTMAWPMTGLPSGECRVWIEANESFDFNDFYHFSFYRGQPSVVWTAGFLTTGAPDTGMVLDYAGYGSTDGSNGDVHPPDSTITTAEDLLDDLGGYKLMAIFTPGAAGIKNDESGVRRADSFRLGQNHPNPFNASTEIAYSIAETGRVVITVYDARGRAVNVLVDGIQSAGAGKIRWDGRDGRGRAVSSGIYIVRLQAGDFSGTTSMVLLK
jgi:hypothetical protein